MYDFRERIGLGNCNRLVRASYRARVRIRIKVQVRCFGVRTRVGIRELYLIDQDEATIQQDRREGERNREEGKLGP